MKNTLKFALVGAFLSIASPISSAADSSIVIKLLTKEITAKPKNVLAIVAQRVASNKDLAGQIVSAAIVTTEADKELVAQIVDLAIKTAPKKISEIARGALAVAPDAYNEIMEVLAVNTPNGQGDETYTIAQIKAMTPDERRTLFNRLSASFGLPVFQDIFTTPDSLTFENFFEVAEQAGVTGFSAAGNIYSTTN